MSEAVLIALIVQAAGLIGIALAGRFKLAELREAANRAAANTAPNGGSSPYDMLIGQVDSIRRHVETIDERAVIEQRRAEDVRARLLDGQQRLEERQTHQAAVIDRILVQLDVAGAQTDAAVDLIHDLNSRAGG